MRVLLIGGTGNISAAVVDKLLSDGHQVTLLNRGSKLVANTEQIRADRYDGPSFRGAVSGRTFDCVIDMICYAKQDAQMLIDAFADRVDQLIFCSTVDTYLKPAPAYPITEDAPIGADPNFSYAHQKVECERLLESAAREGAFALTIVRPAATYNDASTPIPLVGSGLGLLHRIKTGQPIIVMGDGSSLWSSAHRDDVGRAIANAVGRRAAMNSSYTLAAPEALTWEQYYQTVARIMGAPEPAFVHIPWRKLVEWGEGQCDWCGLNFRFNNVFCSDRAARDLDFQYTIPWAEGARRFIAWHLAHGGIEAPQGDGLYDRIIDRARRSAI